MLRDYYDRVVGKSIDHPDNDPDFEYDDAECARCHGDGMDPYNDYLLPCPQCQSEQTATATAAIARRPTLHLKRAPS